MQDLYLLNEVSSLYGVGPKQTERLGKLGIVTLKDLLFNFPRRYDDFSQNVNIGDLEAGESQTVRGIISRVQRVVSRRGVKVFKVLLADETGLVELIWFNQDYLQDILISGREIIVSGQVSRYRGSLSFSNPAYEVVEDKGKDSVHVGRIVPIYQETAGLTSKWLRAKLKILLASQVIDELKETLPISILRSQELWGLKKSIEQIHFPDCRESLHKARKRLGFEELFFLQLQALESKRLWQKEGKAFEVGFNREIFKDFVRKLPFSLTSGQKKSLKEIFVDIEDDKPMNRLLEGDVGSGKTVVAAATLLNAATSGYQAVIMAPTEILAEQHFESLQDLLSSFNLRIGLLTAAKAMLSSPLSKEDRESLASLGGEEKRFSVLPYKRDTLHEYISLGNVDIVVGTHSLIQDRLQFHKLAMVVIDEQHRFGVEQRGKLTQSSGNPDVLVMTATPIPRTLAIALFGDLDISIIDELPPGRKPIITRMVPDGKRERAYEFVAKQIREGRQVYVVCPLVEESEKLEFKSAIEEYERLKEDVFPEFSVGLLHGRMPSDEKNEVISDFRQKKYDILVTTAVVEVGVDVANATVMVIEGADRFGLSQLHQFRGRVGRGQHQSYCLLFSQTQSEASNQRLQALVRTNNGFELAEEDLKLRGPGEVFGKKQSGMPDLKMASLLDVRLLKQARSVAQMVISRFEEFPDLRKRVSLSSSEQMVVWN